MPDFSTVIQQQWFGLILVAVFGFITGLEMREYLQQRALELKIDKKLAFGTSRTYTFIAIIGYIFTILDSTKLLYLTGLIVISLFLTLFYFKKLQANHSHTMQPLMVLLVYSYGPIVVSLPLWMLVLVFVIIIFTLNAKPLELHLTKIIEPNEIFTLAKFLLLMGVILPLMPHQQISDIIPTSPYKIWLTVVIISAISYIGYLLKRYIFTKQGYFLMGIIGGVYSSTATTIVLAKKAKSLKNYDHNLNAGIVSATGMLYIRLFVLTTIFNPAIIKHIGLPLGLMAFLTFSVAFIVKRNAKKSSKNPIIATGKSNPLELQVALIFATLFVVMTVITQYVVSNYGHVGLNFLSFIVGFTDIDPFVLSVLTGHLEGITANQVASAILIAAASDNLLKATYAYFFSGRKNTKPAIIALLVLSAITLALGLVF
ncbi:Glutamate synthase [NADPH] large chain [hydrothermal vent metagenome]|uniref:Glutamate synthase [NADPH] large chain n=1 Tax=hydrothermal vent metagenome TaxID=652676 RepID=A0A3B0W9U4_9ZZZZ